MLKVMFLCTGNSCRSQMAEGLARAMGKGVITPFSAGLTPSFVQPRAVRVMGEIGLDITGQTSKSIDPELLLGMDVVITLCGHAEALCPTTPPGIKRLHWPIDDPVAAAGTEEEILEHYRRARDEIAKRIRAFVENEIARCQALQGESTK